MGAGKNHQVTSHKSTNMDVDEAQVEEVEAPVAAEPVVESEPLDRESALKRVLKNALAHDGLARGIRECARVLDKRRVHLCVLATNCSEPAYQSSSRLCALSMQSTSWRSVTMPSSVSGQGCARSMPRVTPARLCPAPASASPTMVSSLRPSTSSLRTSASRFHISLSLSLVHTNKVPCLL